MKRGKGHRKFEMGESKEEWGSIKKKGKRERGRERGREEGRK